MARYEITRGRSSTRVEYVNSATGQRHDCGSQRPDTPVQMIVDWAAADAYPGEAVVVDGRLALVKMACEAEVQRESKTWSQLSRDRRRAQPRARA